MKSFLIGGAKVDDLYLNALHHVLTAYQSVSQHPDVRAKTIFFLHRMVDHLNHIVLLPTILPTILQMLALSKSENITPLMELVCQIIIKFKVESRDFLLSIFLDCVNRQFECFKEFVHVEQLMASGQPEASFLADKRFLNSLHKNYFNFLSSIFAQNCASIYLHERILPFVSGLLEPVASGILNQLDQSGNKLCCNIMLQVVKLFDDKIKDFPQILDFCIQKVMPAMIQLTLREHFNTSNFSFLQNLQDICEYLVHCARLFGNPFVDAVGNCMLAKAQMPVQIAQQFCETLLQLNPKALLVFYNQLCQPGKKKK